MMVMNHRNVFAFPSSIQSIQTSTVIPPNKPKKQRLYLPTVLDQIHSDEITLWFRNVSVVLFFFFLCLWQKNNSNTFKSIKERKILTEQENKQKKVTCIKCMWKYDCTLTFYQDVTFYCTWHSVMTCVSPLLLPCHNKIDITT